MALKKEELELIGEYVQNHLSEWLPQQAQHRTSGYYPVELGERIVRVEEELKNQRELMKQGFDHMDKRFEQTDKRLDQMQMNMDKRFAQVDKRFEQVDKRFDEANIRFEAISSKIFNFMIWSFGSTVTVAGIVIAIIKFS